MRHSLFPFHEYNRLRQGGKYFVHAWAKLTRPCRLVLEGELRLISYFTFYISWLRTYRSFSFILNRRFATRFPAVFYFVYVASPIITSYSRPQPARVYGVVGFCGGHFVVYIGFGQVRQEPCFREGFVYVLVVRNDGRQSGVLSMSRRCLAERMAAMPGLAVEHTRIFAPHERATNDG
ncbi:uncharacterized protein K452DRAFT_115087 [Aplosporella prunicola CBS 121167]|uniref:Uncharacterized protein n=1 Tax=Aplosporella prunicola CBS 121167 TaxID=1176127 RepID=A0A6A6B2R9_9PEZI|nr:uncharacterized protein K452DRAFT_115087 [Aplosporella prunicola CBS 121167]KAF2137021.1 hypothetical protein K452DRAFT_115087 [Aplosporella prunicola CBS 121167]